MKRRAARIGLLGVVVLALAAAGAAATLEPKLLDPDKPLISTDTSPILPTATSPILSAQGGVLNRAPRPAPTAVVPSHHRFRGRDLSTGIWYHPYTAPPAAYYYYPHQLAYPQVAYPYAGWYWEPAPLPPYSYYYYAQPLPCTHVVYSYPGRYSRWRAGTRSTFTPKSEFDKGRFGTFLPPKQPELGFAPGERPGFRWAREQRSESTGREARDRSARRSRPGSSLKR